MALGCIVGVAKIVDCIEESNSRWFVGEYGWVLKNRKALAEPIPWKGRLGLWKLPRSPRGHKAIGNLIGVK